VKGPLDNARDSAEECVWCRGPMCLEIVGHLGDSFTRRTRSL